MKRNSLDSVIQRPEAMTSYLAHYGWHFNKKAFEYAVSKMKKKDESGKEKKIEPIRKEVVEELLKRCGVELENDVLYDAAYVANMCKADYLKSSVPDDTHMAKYIKDTIDDDDASDGEVMRCWWAKMVGRGVPVDWEELL